MSKNLILTAAIGYNFQQIEFFIKSLRKYYFENICFVIGKKDTELENGLKKYNCDIVKTGVSKKKIQFKRYEIFQKYLNKKKFKKIFLCDSRDIYFQENPFNFQYKEKINFFLEDYQIKDCPYNSNWIIKLYGQKEFEKISDKIILCSGTVMGEDDKIIEYLDLMSKHVSKFKYKKKLKYLLTFRTDPQERGCDQGHANYLIHKSTIKNIGFYNNKDGPIATAFYLNSINFNKFSMLINDLGNPYLLVHQYDKRWNVFSKHVDKVKNSL